MEFLSNLHIATSDGHVCGTKRTECAVNGHMADQAFDLLVCHRRMHRIRKNDAENQKKLLKEDTSSNFFQLI